MKHITKLTPAIILSILALTACGGGNSKEAIASKYAEFIGGASSVAYNVTTDLDMQSTIYGEDFKMSWDSTDKITRILSTGDFATERKIDAKALENDYNESLSNYIVGGERYTTYDGSAFFKTEYTMDSTLSRGILNIIDQIVSSENTAVNSGTVEVDKVKCLLETGTIKGAYLPYIFDKVNMTGLIDFKTMTDKEVTVDYMLYLNEKTKQPVKLDLQLRDIDGLLTDVVSGIKNDSSNVETDVNTFTVTYLFTEYNTVNAIELPSGANNAVEQKNIDDLSISATGTDKLDTEKNRKVNVAGFTFQVSDKWEPRDVMLDGYDGVASDGNRYKVTRLGYSLSEAKIDITNPVSVQLLVDEIAKSGIDTSDCLNVDAEDSENVTFNIDNIASKEVDYMDANGYSADYLDGGKVKYIMGTKGDTKKEYQMVVFGGTDFVKITFTTDGSELYKDYYDETLTSLIESLDYKAPEKAIEIEITETESDNTEETEAETTEAVEEIRGTVKNPYESKEQIEMRGIDLNSGNIVNEYAVVNSINTDKIIVEQKLKQTGIDTDKNAAVVNVTITTDKVKYTDDSTVDLEMQVSLVDKDGKQVGSLLNDGKPINKEFENGIIFDGDNQSKKVTFAFEMTDDFDEDKDMLKIQYNDPDLGNRDLYIKLK